MNLVTRNWSCDLSHSASYCTSLRFQIIISVVIPLGSKGRYCLIRKFMFHKQVTNPIGMADSYLFDCIQEVPGILMTIITFSSCFFISTDIKVLNSQWNDKQVSIFLFGKWFGKEIFICWKRISNQQYWFLNFSLGEIPWLGLLNF